MRSGCRLRLSLIRRLVAFYAAISVGFFAVTPPAFAALPALAIVEPAAQLLAGLAVQTIGRQVVVTAGVAASDASWVSMLSIAVRTMGILRVVGAGSTLYEFPLQSDTPVPPVPPQAGAYGTTSANPIAFNDPSLRVVVSGSDAFGVAPGAAADGQGHYVPPGTYTWSQFKSQYIALWMQFSTVATTEFFDMWDEAQPGAGGVQSLTRDSVTWYYRVPLIMLLSGEEEYEAIWQGSASRMTVEAPGDGVKRFVISGGGYVADPTDVDWTQAEKDALANPSRIQFTDSNNQNAVSVTRTSSGTQVIAASRADASSVKLRELKIDNAAKPLSVTETTSLAVNPAVVADAAAVNAATGAGSSPGTGTGTGSWPDDYARQATVASIDAGIAQLHQDLTRTEDKADPDIPESSRFTDAFFSGTFDALKGWQLPGHTSQCPVGSFSWNSTTYAIDAHCQLVNDHFNALQAAMTVVWSLLALFIVLRA